MKTVQKGRGSISNPENRYNHYQHQSIDDGWTQEENLTALKTTTSIDNSKSILNPVRSPDLPFDRSINPYRGCEHGCIYCFARPSHAYLDLSPGLDFETKLIAKPEAATLLRKALNKANYQCQPIAMGTNTDPYQPIEREWQITRQILEVLLEHRHPVSIVTKSSLIERDLDLLQQLAQHDLVSVMVSISSLQRDLTRIMEPRTAAPQRRLQTIRTLSEAGIPTGVIVAPIIPFLNDAEIESVLAACKNAGALSADYVMLRLPQEVDILFSDWLQQHYPQKADRILHCIEDIRQGKRNSSTFGERLSGTGEFAKLIAQRFKLSHRKLGYQQQAFTLRNDLFIQADRPQQMELF